MKPVPILIDTDPGQDVDDVLALAFALRHPGLSVRAITTVTHGTVQRARLAETLLAAEGKTGVPVAPGMELPIVPLDHDGVEKRRSSPELLNHAVFPGTGNFKEDAVSLMIRTIEAHPDGIGLVLIGPMTNLACALRRKPSIASNISWIAAMGGEVHLDRVEHNVAWDMQAADIVFSSGLPMFLGTWSVTRRFALSPEDCERIRAHGTELSNLLSRCIDLWWPYKGSKPGPVMYDLAPLVWCLGQGEYVTEEMSLRVDGEGRTVRRDGTPNIQVTVDMDVDRVRDLYWEILLS